MKLSSLVLATVIALAAGACGSDTKGGADAAAGSSAGGTTGSAGTTGGGGTTGAGGRGGATGGGGSAGTMGSAGTSGSAGTTGAGGSGTQPVGAACVNNGMCSQADGPAVCCLQISTCVLANQCPGTPTYVSCETTPCTKAGWICCNAGGMHFCTKQSGCPAP